MDWGKDNIFRLIDEYEKYEELWNPHHSLYYNKAYKQECWEYIASVMGCDHIEVKRKVNSLLSSYRREHRQFENLSAADQEAYVPKWFAYTKMAAFLKDRDRDKGDITMMAPSSSPGAWTMKMKSETETEAENEYMVMSSLDADGEDFKIETTKGAAVASGPPPPQQQQQPLPLSPNAPHMNRMTPGTSPTSPPPGARQSHKRRPQKRPRHHDSAAAVPTEEEAGEVKLGDALVGLQDAVSKYSALNDECGIFGQHIANKLRAYDPVTRAVVQHEINNIIFKSDIKSIQMPSEVSTTSFSGGSGSSLGFHNNMNN